MYWSFCDKIASDHRQKEKRKKRELSEVSSVITSLF